MRKAAFTTEENVKEIGIPEPVEGGPKPSLQTLVSKALEFFMNFERVRFDLPWRWRRWSTVFSSANDVSIIKNNKITKRFEKVRDYELSQFRVKFGLDNNTSKNRKERRSKVSKASQPNIIPNSYYGTSSFTTSQTPGPRPVKENTNDKYKEVPIRIEERKLYAF